MLKFLISTLLLVVVLLAVAFVLTYVFQRKLLYPVQKGLQPQVLPQGVERHDFAGGQGYGLYISPVTGVATATSPAIIFAHGNAELAEQWIEGFSPLAEAGIGVMLVEYPSYGGASGIPSLANMRQMMLDAYAVVTEKPEIDANRIISHGRSLGGGAACLLAEARPVAALVLESTFATLEQLVGELRYPSRFLKDKYDNAGVLDKLDIPVMIYHGRHDELIAVHHAQKLHKAAKRSELFLQDCDHNSCPRPWKELLSFLGKHGIFNSSESLQSLHPE